MKCPSGLRISLAAPTCQLGASHPSGAEVIASKCSVHGLRSSNSVEKAPAMLHSLYVSSSHTVRTQKWYRSPEDKPVKLADVDDVVPDGSVAAVGSVALSA